MFDNRDVEVSLILVKWILGKKIKFWNYLINIYIFNDMIEIFFFCLVENFNIYFNG